MQWQPKAWGQTRLTVDGGEYFQRHELEVLAGGYSSVHYHTARANKFHVLSGTIAVVEFTAWNVSRTLLTKDQTLEVPSLVVHQFQVLEAGQVIEDYWPDRGGIVQSQDIVRLTKGGRMENPEDLQPLAEAILDKEVRGA